ncbi:hypothetical protein GCM10023185_06770 [Hymenobacter saemangeumensis]|uniref:Uncharacterized protein n=1 Tax=Hymenobacter saemangeumensis TaxID=1084522 RepID=A0ABP8I2A5_9BACT
MFATDLLLDDDYDLVLTPGGDVATGESDDQHIALLLLTNQGDWRADPLVGIGLRRHQSGPLGPTEQAAFNRELAVQLQRDGYQVKEATIDDNAHLFIDAARP